MLWWFAQTTLIAGALAVVATLAGRWKRLGPEARHVLWLLVLIKLAIPPFVAWPWSVPDAWPARVEAPVVISTPAPAPAPAPSVDPVAIPDALPTPEPLLVASTPPSPEEVLAGVEVAEEVPRSTAPAPVPIEPPDLRDPAPRAQGPKISEPWDWNLILLAFWLAGSVVVVVRRGFKVFRFHRSLTDSAPAPDWLVDETRAIGDRVGVRPPPVLVTDRVATPLLWCLGRPRLILPEVLIKRLGVDRWPGILAHELAHLARGDHWVVRLELLVEAMWWWNPLFWLARRKVHEQAEIACDARVVRALPERRYAYAEALVDVCEHIARSAIPSPSLGVGGAGAAHSLEGRLHMILRDPIPHRPTRRATLLALLLAALALPAWTLGQQPEAPPTKPEDPFAKPDPQPVASPAPAPQLPPAPAPSSITIESILAAQAKAREGLGNLSFRYVVASRDQTHSSRPRGGMGGMGAAGQGFPALDAMGGMGGGRAPGQPALKMQRVKSVHVQAADVILGYSELLGSTGHYRLDVIEARRGQARSLAWDRRLVAYNGEGYLALEIPWDRTGPVPFRWLGSSSQNSGWGDSLTSTFWKDNNQNTNIFPSNNMDKGINPFEPRPANVLDLAPRTLSFLDSGQAHAEVVGLDTVDGREVVRVAWIANADIGLRGLCWLAPELGYAVVRSDATQDPGHQVAGGRRSWRKRSSDFVKVANLWLPRKVSYEETQADPYGDPEPIRRREQEMTFEDYRVAPTLPAETFRPKLLIQTLDDLSGNFTALPPEVPAGLVARLAKAVAESKFGQPIVERIIEEPKADAMMPGSPGKPGNPPNPAPGVAQPSPLDPFGAAAALKPLDSPLAPVDDPAKADPRMIAKPAPGFEDPISTIDPKTNDPISARDKAELLRRFTLDPEVIALTEQMREASTKLDEARRMSGSRGDPAEARAQRQLDNLKAKYQQLRLDKVGKIREELGIDPTRTRDEIEVLQARRDGKVAEVRKAEAQRELARTFVTRNARLKEKGTNLVSNEEAARADAELAVTEAELAGKKAGLDEADALLNQAKRRLGMATAAKPAPDLVADPFAQPPVAKGSKNADRNVDGLDAQDEVAVLQARRDGKAAELQKAQARLEQAKLNLERARSLLSRKAIGQEEFEQLTTAPKLAEPDVTARKAELAEADVFLSQAKRRLTSRPAASTAGDRPSTLPELRDAIELTEVQLQGKQAELRKVQAMADLARREAANAKRLADNNAVSKTEVDLHNDKADASQGELEAKKAEVLEFEIRIKQAKRRLEATEARLRREVERAKAHLDISEKLFKSGELTLRELIDDRARFDELMIQLDPKYVPAPAAEAPKAGVP